MSKFFLEKEQGCGLAFVQRQLEAIVLWLIFDLFYFALECPVV